MRTERGGRGLARSLLIGLLLAPCITSVARAAAPAITPDEYVVLAAVVEHGLEPGTKSVAVATQTTGDPSSVVPPGADLEALAKKLETTPQLLATWAALNQQVSVLDQKLVMQTPYELVDETLRAKLFTDDDPAAGWERFHKRFPHAPGLLRVSRVALDEAHVNALVYVEFACGPTCGAGRLIRASRIAERWTVLSGELMWVAGDRE